MGSPFDPAAAETQWVWLCHDAGVPARFPDASVPLWKARGWRPCDAPAEVDLTRIEQLAVPRPTEKEVNGDA